VINQKDFYFALRVLGYQIRVMRNQGKSILYFFLTNFVRFFFIKNIVVKTFLVKERNQQVELSKNNNIAIYFDSTVDYKYFDNFLPLAKTNKLFPHVLITINNYDLLNDVNYATVLLDKKTYQTNKSFFRKNIFIFLNYRKLMINIAKIYLDIAYKIFNKIISKYNYNLFLGDIVLPLNSSLLNIIKKNQCKYSINSPNLHNYEYIYLSKLNLFSKFKSTAFKSIRGNSIINHLFLMKINYFKLPNNNLDRLNKSMNNSYFQILYISQPYEYKSLYQNLYFRLKEVLLIIILLLNSLKKEISYNKKIIFRRHPREKIYDIKFLIIKLFILFFRNNNVELSNINKENLIEQLYFAKVLVIRDSTVIFSFLEINNGKILLINKNIYKNLVKKKVKNVYFLSTKYFMNYFFNNFKF